MAVKIVTDSTSDIPSQVAEALGVTIVPIYVRFGGTTYRDGVDILPEELYSKLETAPVFPATSQPNPEDFCKVYDEACQDSEGVVSIHISSKISGTFNSAVMAKRTLEGRCRIEVIDSKFNSAGLGLVVQAAARAAKSGFPLDDVVAEAKKAIGQTGMFGMFGTMKYLARSGRVSKSLAAAAKFLNVKPLLTFHDGEIARAGLVRTIEKGKERILEYVNRSLPVSDIMVVHSRAIEEAIGLKQRMAQFAGADRISIAELGAGLGVHGGPGVLLVAVRKMD